MGQRPNVLIVVIDQLRADCVHGALARHVELPNMRALAADAVRFDAHYTVTTPCGPSRVSLLTGQYAMNHGAIRNGTPMRHDTPTLGTVLRDAGIEPLLFGYTDTSADPRVLPADDPRLSSYEELSPGWTEVVRMRQEQGGGPWEAYLAAKGIGTAGPGELYRPAGDSPDAPAAYSAADSDTAFLTDRLLEDLATRAPGWCALATYIRPHPPLVAPAPYNKMYDPATMPPARRGPDIHPFLGPARDNTGIASTVVGFPDLQPTEENVAMLRALYFGLATEVDHHLGRVFGWLKETGQYEDTLIVVTADHGEMLGDFGLWGKRSYHDAAAHVPLIIRAPGMARGRTVSALTESIDLAPTILRWLGLDVPHSMDGCDLAPLLRGDAPAGWRTESLTEIDLADPIKPTEWQRQLGLGLDDAGMAILRTEKHRWVQFAADLPSLLFDLDDDFEVMNHAEDPAKLRLCLDLSRRMLSHRMRNADGLFSRTLITSDGVKVAAE